MISTLVAVVASLVLVLLLALVARDTWLRTLTARKQDVADADRAAITLLGERCSKLEAEQREQHGRLLAVERRQPVRRA